MLMPKKVKYRKQQRGRMAGKRVGRPLEGERHRDGGDVCQEQRVAPAERYFREGVRGERRGEELCKRHNRRHRDGVAKVREQGDTVPYHGVIIPTEGIGEPAHGDGEHVHAGL